MNIYLLGYLIWLGVAVVYIGVVCVMGKEDYVISDDTEIVLFDKVVALVVRVKHWGRGGIDNGGVT